MSVVLHLGPGESRQLDGLTNVVGGGNTQVAAETIGVRRLSMSPIDAATPPEVDRSRSKLNQMGDATVQKAVFVKFTCRIVG